MQLGEERADVNDERNAGHANEHLVKQIAPRRGCDNRSNDPEEMKTQVERSLQGTAHNHILHKADQKHTKERAEKPAGMTEIIYSQIDDRFAESVRQRQGRKEVKQDGLEEKNRELKKRPGMSPAITEHRPPGLDIDDQKEQGPSDGRPIDADT